MATKSKSKPASATPSDYARDFVAACRAPSRPVWRVTSAHLPVTGGRIAVYSDGAAYGVKIPTPHGEETDYARDFEAACRAGVRGLTDGERRRILASDPQWIITGAIMEMRGAAVRRLSVQLIGDEIQWQAINEGRAAARGSTDFATDARRDAEQWAHENGWMCPDCGGPMHQCKTGDAGCWHCDSDNCAGAVAPRRGV